MNRIYSFFYVIIILCFLIGCRSIPMSTESNPTLLAGEIAFIGSNYFSRDGISFIGTTNSGIEIVIKNTYTNESFRFSSGKNGLFYINLQEGKYSIDELYLKKVRSDGAWSYIYTNPNKILSIERGKVNNVGKINWSFDARKHNVGQTDNSSAVKNEFSKQFPKSNWNQNEWKFSPFVYEIKRSSEVFVSSGEKVTYYIKSDDGQDSTRITMPKDMPVEVRQQIEADAKKRVNDSRIQGDTTYYVKNENGIDSILLKTPKMMPEDMRRDVEERMRQDMKNR